MHTNKGYSPMRERKIRTTVHASKRCAQRGIDQTALPLIKAFGESAYDGRGGIRYTMTSRAIKRLEKSCGSTPQIENVRGQYMVIDAESETAVITVGHRH